MAATSLVAAGFRLCVHLHWDAPTHTDAAAVTGVSDRPIRSTSYTYGGIVTLTAVQ